MKTTDRFLALGMLSILVTGLVGVIAFTALARSSGSPTAPFSLTATDGRVIDRSVFQDKPTLLYFGYTHCPEVCPTTLIDMAQWLEILGDDADDLQAFFFTVDPARDTLDVMTPYVAAFSDDITGVTGDPAEMRQATQAFVVTADENETTSGYSMSHTTSILLVGANGRLAGLIPYGTMPEDAVEKIRQTLLPPAA